MSEDRVTQTLRANADAARQVFASLPAMGPSLSRAADMILAALTGGKKLLACGNGGSAADAAHFTAEFAGRYVRERRGYPAIDLTAEHSLVTALINDFPAEQLFARQVRALGAPGDVLAVFTTSGNSANVRLALLEARSIGLKTIAFLGRGGGACRGVADVEFIVASDVTARIQEGHQLLYHTICEVLDPQL